MNNMPIEIEREYIIKTPDIALISSFEGYTSSVITQIYLESTQGVTHRIRKREFADKTVYTETKKIKIDKMSAIEDEHEISEKEFARLAERQKKGTDIIYKTRHTVKYGELLLEIDVYPNWKSHCIMEIELENKDVSVAVPDFIEIVAEVTGDKKYSNASMSEKFPGEINDR